LSPIDRFVIVVPWVSMALPTLLWTLGLEVPVKYRWGPLFASVLVFGLPHGALDHLAMPRLRGEPAGPRWLARVGAIYFVLGGAYAVVWFLAPAVAVVGFILLTWAHWGQGDLHPLRAVLGADHLDDRLGRWLTVGLRGGIPMLVPLLSFPERYRAVIGRLLALFDIAPSRIAWAFSAQTRLGIAIAIGGLTVLALGRGVRRSSRDRRAWAIDAGEVALLWWCFWVVPPLVAVGIYFALWHSVRHVGRLMAIDGRSAGLSASLAGFARDAAPLSIASIVFLGGLALAVPRTPTTLPELVALYLVALAVLTLPHVAVVAWMDREQGIW
jgi:Brp/Blh family beta-carotene 15,15'-monooxygenase